MATYAELLSAFADPGLRNKIRVAIPIAAEKIRTAASPPANQAKRLKWAARAMGQTDTLVDTMMRAVLVQNQGATLAQITGASDAAVQAAVDAAVDLFADLEV